MRGGKLGRGLGRDGEEWRLVRVGGRDILERGWGGDWEWRGEGEIGNGGMELVQDEKYGQYKGV